MQSARSRVVLMPRWSAVIVASLVMAVCVGVSRADTKTWVGTGTNDWSVDGNWSPGGAPQAGDDVVIAHAQAGVVLTHASPYFKSLRLSNAATLVFSNWDTVLSAGNITLAGNAVMTCAGPFTNNVMSNRVYLVCSNLTIKPGGRINVNGKGYKGGGPNTTNRYLPGNGPGGWVGQFSGAAYGGKSRRTLPYGSAANAGYAGSGGTAGYYPTCYGGDGGGAVRIEAAGRVNILGAITANGGDAGPWKKFTHASAGTGGGIFISCRAVNGTNGLVEARGGGGAHGVGDVGAGGRIAVHYLPAAQSREPSPQIRFDCSRGSTQSLAYVVMATNAEAGTIYFADGRFVADLIHGGRLAGQIVLGVTNWSVDHLTISNCWIGFPQDNIRLTVTNDVRVIGLTGRLEIGGAHYAFAEYPNHAGHNRHSGKSCPVLQVGGNLVLTNGGRFHVYSGTSPATLTNYGALVSIGGDMRVFEGSRVCIGANPTNSGSPVFRMRNLWVSSNACFNADYAGYSGRPGAPGHGPGGGSERYDGGSHGGAGGCSLSSTYGLSNTPVDAGSEGSGVRSGYPGGAGGGVIRIESQEKVTLNGLITANGYKGKGRSGGGAGGSIYIRCRTLDGSHGVLQTIGGSIVDSANTNAGAGGGGRIAVWRVHDSSVGIIATAAGGANNFRVASSNSEVQFDLTRASSRKEKAWFLRFRHFLKWRRKIER